VGPRANGLVNEYFILYAFSSCNFFRSDYNQMLIEFPDCIIAENMPVCNKLYSLPFHEWFLMNLC